MAWNDPVNDKKWSEDELLLLKGNLATLDSHIKGIEFKVASIFAQATLTFIKPRDKLELLVDLNETLQKLENAKATIEVWIRSPDIYAP